MQAGDGARLRDLGRLPMHDGDLEAERGLPAAVLELKAQFAGHDGFLIASPARLNFPPFRGTILTKSQSNAKRE